MIGNNKEKEDIYKSLKYNKRKIQFKMKKCIFKFK